MTQTHHNNLQLFKCDSINRELYASRILIFLWFLINHIFALVKGKCVCFLDKSDLQIFSCLCYAFRIDSIRMSIIAID
jgi:hypothetical protein